MKQKEHYTKALAYLRDRSNLFACQSKNCLRHGRPMHFARGDIFEAEGTATRSDGLTSSISSTSTPSKAPTYWLRSPFQALSGSAYRGQESIATRPASLLTEQERFAGGAGEKKNE